MGTGESGKSTFMKQMRIINGNEFQAEELKQFKLIIYGNIIKGMKVILFLYWSLIIFPVNLHIGNVKKTPVIQGINYRNYLM